MYGSRTKLLDFFIYTFEQFDEHRENSNIYFYFIFQLILDIYHSIHTSCMEKHNLSIFTYHFGIKFIIWNMFYNITHFS